MGMGWAVGNLVATNVRKDSLRVAHVVRNEPYIQPAGLPPPLVRVVEREADAIDLRPQNSTTRLLLIVQGHHGRPREINKR